MASRQDPVQQYQQPSASTSPLSVAYKPIDAPGSSPLQRQASPSTPPPASLLSDLPTPPTSHVDFRPPHNPVVSKSAASHLDGQQSRLDASPTTRLTHSSSAQRRLAARHSSDVGSAAMRPGQPFSPTLHRSAKVYAVTNGVDHARKPSLASSSDERKQALQQAERARQISRGRTQRSTSSSRSRTPSPILGASIGHLDPDYGDDRDASLSSLRVKAEGQGPSSMGDVDSLGRLSMPVLGLGLGASREEVELLVYGSSGSVTHPPNPASREGRSSEDSREVEQTLQSLAKMGLEEPDRDRSATERERELASMVKALAHKCDMLSLQRDGARAELQSNRLTALSILSSTKTAHAHALAAERTARDRLDAELDGWKAQAKMLRALRSRAEARGHTERRVTDGLDAAGGSSSSRTANAAWAPISRLPVSRSDDSIGGAAGIVRNPSEAVSIHSRPSSAKQLQGAFEPKSPHKASPHNRLAEPSTPAGEEGRGRDRNKEGLAFAAQVEARAEEITGLSIFNGIIADGGLEESPMSAVVRERNKLATDKRYLKTRLRDTEAQASRLEAELMSLRPYLVAGGIKLAEADRLTTEPASQRMVSSTATATDGAITAPVTPSRSSGRRDKSRKKRTVAMGDAETEHLMLAARRLREMRKAEDVALAATASATKFKAVGQPIPTNSGEAILNDSASSISVLAPAAELTTSSIAQASPVKRQASEGTDRDHPLMMGSPHSPLTKMGERPPKTPKSNNSVLATPKLADLPRQSEQSEASRLSADPVDSVRGSQHRRFESSASVSSFTGIDELLQAAETLNPGAAAAAPLPAAAPSPRMCVLPEHEPVAFASSDHRPRYVRDSPHAHHPLPPHTLHPVHTHTRELDYDGYGYSQHQAVSSPIRLPHESPKRRRVSSAAIDIEPFGSPFISDRQLRGRTNTEGADLFGQVPTQMYPDYANNGPPSAGASQALSALDLLADQAAASLNPSMGSDRSGGYDGVSPLGSLSSDDEAMVINGDPDSRSKRSKGGAGAGGVKGGSRKSPSRGGGDKVKGSGSTNGGISATDASQGSNKSTGESRSFGGNQNSEKRLPYVRWTNEEDTKLRAAIKEHGQRWELISRAVGTRSYHQCRQRYLLMRRKEAAAKAQAEADEAANTGALASASDQQSQEEEGVNGRGPPASASVSRKKSGQRSRANGGGGGGRGSANDERYDDHDDGGISDDRPHAGDITVTPLHKFSIGAPPPGGGGGGGSLHNGGYYLYSPTPRHSQMDSVGGAHTRSLSHPHGGSSSHVLPPIASGPAPPHSPYSSHHSTTQTARRTYYPASSPLIPGSRQLPPLGGPAVHSYATSSPIQPTHFPGSPLHHHRQFIDGSRGGGGIGSGMSPHTGGVTDPTQTTPTNASTTARRMGAALYS